jgi:hypothetical protein
MLMRPVTNGYVQHQMMPKVSAGHHSVNKGVKDSCNVRLISQAMPQSGYTQVDAFGKPVVALPSKPDTPLEIRNMKLNMKTPIIAQTDEEGISGK